MARLVIQELFGLVEVQGPPVFGLRRFGVPVGGWFDRGAARQANELVGLEPESLCLELTMARLRFRTDQALAFSLTGAPCDVIIDGQRTGSGGLFWVASGSEVTISFPKRGARAYLAARFMDLPAVGSRIQVKDSLSIQPTNQTPKLVWLQEEVDLSEGSLRILPGPQVSYFDLAMLTNREFTLSDQSNRVGIRLKETVLPHRIELPSEPAGFGAIQVTPQGSLIILGPDGPTIGGYPKIAFVMTSDLDSLGQLRPEQTLRFDCAE